MATRKRTIQPNIWQDPDFGMLSPVSKLVFIGLITMADDEGRLLGHPAMISSSLSPYFPILDQVTDALEEITHRMKNVLLYEIEGQYYIQLKNWLKHQTLREDRSTKSQFPPPPKKLIVPPWQTDDGQLPAEVREVSKEREVSNTVFINENPQRIDHPIDKLRRELEAKGILKKKTLI